MTLAPQQTVEHAEVAELSQAPATSNVPFQKSVWSGIQSRGSVPRRPSCEFDQGLLVRRCETRPSHQPELFVGRRDRHHGNSEPGPCFHNIRTMETRQISYG